MEPRDNERRQGLLYSLGLPGLIHATVLAIGLVAWLVTTHNQIEIAARDLSRVESSLTEKIADLRAVVTAGQAEVHQQIAVLPDQRVRIEVLEQRVIELENRSSTLGNVVAGQEKTSAQHQEDLNLLMRAVNTPLGRTRR